MGKPVVRRDAPVGAGRDGRWAWQLDEDETDEDATDGDHAPAGDGGEPRPRPGSSGTGSETADPRQVARSEGAARGRFATSPIGLPTAGWKDVVRRTLQEVKADNVPITAAGVAFYGMLALVPALVAIVSVYGLATSPEASARQVEGFTSALPGEAARLLVDQIRSITGQPSSGLGVKLALSLAGLLWTASSGTSALIRGLGIAYDEPEGRGFVKLRSRALLLTVAAVIGAVVVLGLTVALPAVLDVADLGSVGTTIGLVLRWPVLGVLFILGLSTVYRYGPDRDQAKWRWVSPGALVATVLWVLGTGLFGFYAGRFASYNETYGTLSGAIVLLLWLYLTSLVILLGAELNSELERQTLKDSTVGRPGDLGERKAQSADTVGAAASSRSGGGSRGLGR